MHLKSLLTKILSGVIVILTIGFSVFALLLALMQFVL